MLRFVNFRKLGSRHLVYTNDLALFRAVRTQLGRAVLYGNTQGAVRAPELVRRTGVLENDKLAEKPVQHQPAQRYCVPGIIDWDATVCVQGALCREGDTSPDHLVASAARVSGAGGAVAETPQLLRHAAKVHSGPVDVGRIGVQSGPDNRAVRGTVRGAVRQQFPGGFRQAGDAVRTVLLPQARVARTAAQRRA